MSWFGNISSAFVAYQSLSHASSFKMREEYFNDTLDDLELHSPRKALIV